MADADSGVQRRKGAAPPSSADSGDAKEKGPDEKGSLDKKGLDTKGEKGLDKKGGPVQIASFLLFIWYTQASSGVVFLGILLGYTYSHSGLCAHFCRILNTKYAITKNSEAVMDDTAQPVFFFSNHRSWGDFYCDAALLGGTSFVSRWMVAVGMPVAALWGWTQGWIWFFQRGKKQAGGTVKHMVNFYSEQHKWFSGKGVVIYPEGTRNLKPQGEALRPGGLAVVHSMGWPVQMVITTNKEDIIQERNMRLGNGAVCTTSVSKPIWPKDFKTVDEFMAEVNKVWRATWDDAYNNKGKGIPRQDALLPTAVLKSGAPAIPGHSGINKARAISALLALLIAYYTRRRLA